MSSSFEQLIADALPLSTSSFIYPRVLNWKNLVKGNSYKIGDVVEFVLELDFINQHHHKHDGKEQQQTTEDLIKAFPEDEFVIVLTLERLFERNGIPRVEQTNKTFSSRFHHVDVSELEIDGMSRNVAAKIIPITFSIPNYISDYSSVESAYVVNCKVEIGQEQKKVKDFPVRIECETKKRKPMLGFDMLYCTSETSKDSTFSYPLDVTIYYERNIFYLTDTYNRRIAVFDLDTKQFKFHIYPPAYPRCLVISEVDDCIIFTCDDNYVYKYTHDGSKLIWKSYPELNWPRGLVIDPTNEDIYICDFDNHRIQIISKNGDILRSFGSHGSEDSQFNGPKDIDFDLDGNLVVSDRENHRILVLSKLDGSLIRKIQNGRGYQPGQFASQEGFCIDRTNGNIIVCDSMNDRIQIFNSKLQFITSFGEAGIEKSELTKPTGCALNEKLQELLVVEWNNQRLQTFRYPLLSKNAKQIKTKLTKCLNNGTLSDVNIKISDRD